MQQKLHIKIADDSKDDDDGPWIKEMTKSKFFGGLLVVVGLKNPKSSLDYEAACWLVLRKT